MDHSAALLETIAIGLGAAFIGGLRPSIRERPALWSLLDGRRAPVARGPDAASGPALDAE